MNKIKRLRVVPPKYILVDEGQVFDTMLGGVTMAEVFLALYKRFGKAEGDTAVPFYVIRMGDVVFNLCFSDKLVVSTYIAPILNQIAEKKRIKVLNILARKVNEENIVFMPSNEVKLYFTIDKKNKALYERQKTEFSDNELQKRFYGHIGTEGERMLHGAKIQYVPEVEAVMRDFVSILKEWAR